MDVGCRLGSRTGALELVGFPGGKRLVRPADPYRERSHCKKRKHFFSFVKIGIIIPFFIYQKKKKSFLWGKLFGPKLLTMMVI